MRRFRGDERRACEYAYLFFHRQTIALLLEIAKEMTFAGNADSPETDESFETFSAVTPTPTRTKSISLTKSMSV